jgi:phage gp46-like protein
MKRTFQGDPRLVIGTNGTTLKFTGGQPVMDAGLENYILHRLFVKQGWVGNFLFPDTNNQIGTDFEETASGTLTLQKLTDIEKAGERALKKLEDTGFAESVRVEVFNPNADSLRVEITVKQPDQEAEQLTLSRVNSVWRSQFLDPAYEKIT